MNRLISRKSFITEWAVCQDQVIPVHKCNPEIAAEPHMVVPTIGTMHLNYCVECSVTRDAGQK